jgi:hypothetical protein
VQLVNFQPCSVEFIWKMQQEMQNGPTSVMVGHGLMCCTGMMEMEMTKRPHIRNSNMRERRDLNATNSLVYSFLF